MRGAWNGALERRVTVIFMRRSCESGCGGPQGAGEPAPARSRDRCDPEQWRRAAHWLQTFSSIGHAQKPAARCGCYPVAEFDSAKIPLSVHQQWICVSSCGYARPASIVSGTRDVRKLERVDWPAGDGPAPVRRNARLQHSRGARTHRRTQGGARSAARLAVLGHRGSGSPLASARHGPEWQLQSPRVPPRHRRMLRPAHDALAGGGACQFLDRAAGGRDRRELDGQDILGRWHWLGIGVPQPASAGRGACPQIRRVERHRAASGRSWSSGLASPDSGEGGGSEEEACRFDWSHEIVALSGVTTTVVMSWRALRVAC